MVNAGKEVLYKRSPKKIKKGEERKNENNN